MAEHNERSPRRQRLLAGDKIFSINGVEGQPMLLQLQAAVKLGHQVRVRVQR